MITCWFWESACRIDYPAWVQAIGSVVAIGIAIWLPQRQRRHDFNLRKNSQSHIGHHFSQQINAIFDAAYTASKNLQKGEFKGQAEKLQDLIELSRAFQIDTFHYDKMAGFLRIRAGAIELKIAIDEFKGANTASAAENVSQIFDKIKGDIFWQGINLPEWAAQPKID